MTLERIADLPDHVIGLVAHGTVTADDYRQVLEPTLNADYADGRKPRVVFVVDSDFDGFSAGAMWEDVKFGVGHLTGWDKIALVGEPDWITHTANFVKGVVPGRLKVFPLDQRDAALEWITS